MSLLELQDVSVRVRSDERHTDLVREISLSVAAGETLCIVGESGSGKTVTAMSIIRLLEYIAPVTTIGEIRLEGIDMAALSRDEMRAFRSGRIGMIFQEALGSLNPSQRIGKQLLEAYAPADLRAGGERTAKARLAAGDKARALLTEVGLGDTDRIMSMYPHQLSGGMQQRVMIAMALMSEPALLIADEPTTALDVTTQADILALLKRLQREHGMATIFITHDMGVAAEISDRVAVMYGGRIVEVGPTAAILSHPRHHYTRALLQCVPRLGVRARGGLAYIPGSVPAPQTEMPGCRYADRCPAATDRCFTEAPALEPVGISGLESACWNPAAEPLVVTTAADRAGQPAASDDLGFAIDREQPPALKVEGLTKVFGARSGFALRKRAGLTAVNGLDLSIARGEFFGLVGESGSGKSTFGRMITALETPTAGTITAAGHTVTSEGVSGDHRDFRRKVQLIFQDPQSSLDPRHTVERIVGEGLRELTGLRGAALATRVRDLIDEVGLPAAIARKYPSEISGGQRQRVAIARAIAPEPELIVADEPTSALDVSVQGQVINLLLELGRHRSLSYLFITHNLSLVLSVADRVGVMYQGSLIEVDTAERIVHHSVHPYTRRLLDANPDLRGVGAS